MHVNDVDVGEGAREVPPDSWVEPDRCCRTIHGEDGGATEQDRAGRALVSRSDDDGIVTYVAQPTGEPDDLVLDTPRPAEVVRGDKSDSHT